MKQHYFCQLKINYKIIILQFYKKNKRKYKHIHIQRDKKTDEYRLIDKPSVCKYKIQHNFTELQITVAL